MSVPKDPQELADEYLKQHHIVELFEVHQHKSLDNSFRIYVLLFASINLIMSNNSSLSNLNSRKTKVSLYSISYKSQSGYMTGIFGPGEIKNVFQLMDLRNSGYINKEQCKEALKSLASSEFQFQNVEDSGKDSAVKISDKVDYEEFRQLW